MNSIFDPSTLELLLHRISLLSDKTKPKWGKMNATEMLAHCSLVFEYNNGQRQAKVSPIMKFFLKPMMRKVIVGAEPYKQNSPTAPYFKVVKTEVFELEKARLIANLTKYSKDGATGATSREHVWLGPISAEDWSQAMTKHLDHHLGQFGV
ncbi:DUF1569 domain-containing protein [bacterium]|jgi:hypothetical protein|nr:DUF1569 domain-containing protein [bacterium]MDC1221396.1 DUF1569 domain-containing protein [Salibacteraceae bacterium]